MIRELLKSFRFSILLAIVAVFAACTKTEYVEVPVTPGAPEEKAPTYTIMLYGTGGGLDVHFNNNMEQLATFGKQDRVNFRALFKYSKSKQSRENCDGTRLLTLTNEGLKNEKKYEASYRMDNPAHLADFIKETKEQMPADKYILILWDHGMPFSAYDKFVQDSYPEDDKVLAGSRAMMVDDNFAQKNKVMMSIYEIEKGIKDSGTKMDLIYFDACNMNMIEYYAQLKDLTHYAMASFEQTPGIGGNYYQLLYSLQNNATLEDAMKQYVPKCVSNWKNLTSERSDLECYDMTYMDELLGYTQETLSEYVKHISSCTGENQQQLDYLYCEQASQEQKGFVFYADGSSKDYLLSADLVMTLRKFSLRNGLLSARVSQIDNCIDKMTIAQANANMPSYVEKISMGIDWPSKAQTEQFYNKESHMKDIYGASVFDQYTHWGDYLAKFNYYMKRYDSVFTDSENAYFAKFLVGKGYSQYPFAIRWYFKQEDLDPEVRQEADEFAEAMTNDYAPYLKGKKYPLQFYSAFKEELQNVFYNNIYFLHCLELKDAKYAHNIYVDIYLTDTKGYANDDDKDNYPVKKTIEFKIY